MNTKDTALYYKNELGFSIIPAGVGKIKKGKAEKIYPIKWGEFQNRKASDEEIEKWYKDMPKMGIAIVCGKISNLVVLDVDKSEFDFEKYNIPKDTPRVKTGRSGGGYHFYFRYPKNREIKGTIIIEDGVELKGGGGTAHAPPTRYVGDISYEWIIGLKDNPIADLPQEILDAIPQEKETQAYEGQQIETGSRNINATSYIGKLLEKTGAELWEEICWPALQQYNQTRFETQLPEGELRMIFKSIAAKELTRRGTPATTENPTDKMIDFASFYDKEYPKVKWLIDNIIPTNATTFLSAPPGYYKSWLIYEMAVKIAKGENFMSNFATTKTKVLIINEEMYEGLVQERFKALTENKDIDIILSNNNFIKFDKKEHVEALLKYCKDQKIGLVIIDSLSRIHSRDENSADSVKQLFDNFKRFTLNEISLLFTHHNRKTGLNDKLSGNMGEQMRGSSDLLAMIDVQLMIVKKKEYMVLHQPKQRLGKSIDPFKFILHERGDKVEWENLGNFKEGKEDLLSEEVQDAIINVLRDKDGATVAELLNVLSDICKERMMRTNLKYMEDMEQICSTRKGNGGKKSYFIPKEEDVEPQDLGLNM